MKFRSAIALVLLTVIAGCGDPGAVPGDRRPLVIATTGMIADLASRVGGSRVEVRALMGPGVDPHLYKPSAGDVELLQRSDLILLNGLHLEGKMGDILAAMERTRPVVALGSTLPEERLRRVPGFQGSHDPHIWFDVSLFAGTVPGVRDALKRVLPSASEEFDRNAAALESELRELDSWVSARIETLPPDRRVMVTAHDAFGYFGRRYGVEVVGLQGVSTATEAGLQDVDRLAGWIADRRVKAIFVESSVPRRSIEAVQAACRARGHEVAIGGQLFSDAMGAPGTEEGTYPGMIRHNVNTLVESVR